MAAPLQRRGLDGGPGTLRERTEIEAHARGLHFRESFVWALLLFVTLLSGHKLEAAKVNATGTSEQIVDVKMEKTQAVVVNRLCRSS